MGSSCPCGEGISSAALFLVQAAGGTGCPLLRQGTSEEETHKSYGQGLGRGWLGGAWGQILS